MKLFYQTDNNGVRKLLGMYTRIKGKTLRTKDVSFVTATEEPFYGIKVVYHKTEEEAIQFLREK